MALARWTCCFAFALAVYPLLGKGCASLPSANAAVITVDAAAEKASSDTASLDPHWVKKEGEQVAASVRSTIMDAQTFTLKISGLADASYDVYVNGSCRGESTADQLAVGFQITIPGTIGPADVMRCVNASKARIQPEYERLAPSKDPEEKRVWFTYGKALDWCRSAINHEATWRSVDVLIAPSGKALKQMIWRTRLDKETTLRGLAQSCRLLQQARDRMNRVIKNPELRNQAVVTLTPVDFTAKLLTVNGKPRVELRLTNNCNLPVSGKFGIALPKGWKTTARTLDFTDIGSGKTHVLAADLIAPSRTAQAPESLPVAAYVTVTLDRLTASCKIKSTAVRVL